MRQFAFTVEETWAEMKSTWNSVQNPVHMSQEDVLNTQAGDVTLKSKKLEERAWVYGTLSS